MTNAEIRNLSETEIEKTLKELKEELLNLRFQHTINQLENPMRIGAVRKDIARVKTVISQRELAEAKQ